MEIRDRIDACAYLIKVFKKERPEKSVRDFKDKLYQLSNEDLFRIADAVSRFGLNNLI